MVEILRRVGRVRRFKFMIVFVHVSCVVPGLCLELRDAIASLSLGLSKAFSLSSVAGLGGRKGCEG
jgi:hypothetical protein